MITGQRLDAVVGIIIYWQIQTINQTDRSSDMEQKQKEQRFLTTDVITSSRAKAERGSTGLLHSPMIPLYPDQTHCCSLFNFYPSFL